MAYRRSVRIGFGALAALVVLVAIGLAALPFMVRPLTVWQLGKTVKRPVTLEAATLNLFTGRLAARGLHITDHDGGPLATLERMEARFRPLDLLRARFHLVEGTLDGLTVRVVRTGPRQFNVTDLVADRPAAEGGPPVATVIERFAVRNVVITVEDRTLAPAKTSRIELAADVANASTLAGRGPGQARLRGTVAGAPIELAVSELRLDPLHLRATFSARDLDAPLASIAMPPGNPFVPTRGTLTMAATVAHDAEEGTMASVELSSRDVELSRYNTAFLSAPAVRLTVDNLRARGQAVDIERLTVDGGTIVLADAQLGTAKRWQIDGVRVEAANVTSARDKPGGTATGSARMAGAEVSLWAANVRLAPVELHATTIVRNVDLAVMRAYLPPALPVQPERGLVNATVRVDHGAHGTRLAVDAALSDLEVFRPGHVVTSPGLRLIATDVAVEGSAVAIGHVTLNGERLTLEERNVKPVRTWAIQGLAVEARDLSTRPADVQGLATVNARIAGGTAAAWVTGLRLDPLALNATASLRNLDLSILRFYLPTEAPIEFTRGAVNAALQLSYTAAQGTRITGDATLTGVDARGRWQFSTMALSAPSARITLADVHQHGERFSIGRLEATAAGTFSDSRGPGARVQVANVSLATEGLGWPASSPARVSLSARFQDRGELEASGTARLTAAPPAIGWSVELDSQIRRVDITPLAAFVPAAQGVGGQVRGKLAMAISQGETFTARVRGEVSGSRLVLDEGKRTLVSLRRFSATGVDVDWPSRVTVGQLRLGQPFAWVERDSQGVFPLLARLGGASSAAAPLDSAASSPAPTPPSSTGTAEQPAVSVAELIVEGGSATLVDHVMGPTARVEIPRIELFVRDVTWPAPGAARLLAEVEFPGGGIAKAEGTVTPEPAAVDLKVNVKDVDIASFQSYLNYRARLRGRIDADVTVAGALTSGGRVAVRGDAGVRAFSISDGLRPLVTTERIRVRGLDALWPERVVMDRVRVQKSWAILERDRQGQFYLRTLFERPPAPAGAPPPPAEREAGGPPAPAMTLEVREAVFDDQSAMIIDRLMNPPARIEVAGAQMTVRDLTWPQRAPVQVTLNSPTPGGGRMAATGTVSLDPVRMDLRVALDNVAIEPAQAYLPIAGQVMGQATGDVNVVLALDPLGIQATGEMRLQRFRLNDGDRAVVTVGRMDTTGIDVDWPKRVAVEKVLLRRPRLLVERDPAGEILIARLLELDWDRVGGATAAEPARRAGVATPASTGSPSAAPPPPFEVGTLILERGSGRFVDQTTAPPFAEEMDDLNVTITGLSTAPGRRTRFTASGSVGGGTFKAHGDTVQGERDVLNVHVEVRNYIVPRANPYLDRFTAWQATNGVVDLTAHYALDGTRLESRHEVRVRDLEVQPVGDRDEVEQRVGLPFGMLVSLLKDARNQISLTLPVAGDLGTREFNFQDAVWGAVRSLALRLVALPFSKIGSLFVSNDSKVEAVAIKPVVFPPGTAELSPEMVAHLKDVAKFLHDSPSVKVTLRPIMTQADVDALRQQANDAAPATSAANTAASAPSGAPTKAPAPAAAPSAPAPTGPPAGAPDPSSPSAGSEPPVPGELLRELATRRLDAVRKAVAVDPARLPGRARRAPLIEATGASRVELDLRPEAEEVSSSAER